MCILNSCFHDFVQLKRTETETTESVSAARRMVEVHERDCQETRSKSQKLDVELNLKNEEANSVSLEMDQKRSQLTRLASSRNAIQQNQVEFDAAQVSFDEFNEGYQTRNNELKRQIKVRMIKFISLCVFI